MATYKKDTDYTALIEQAAKAGNYGGAALLEQQRNAKIADMNAAGDNTYTATNNYGQYLPSAGTSPYGSAETVYTHNSSQDDIKKQMNANSASWWGAKGMGDTAQMQTLEQANQKLSALLGGLNYNSTQGKWSGVADVPATLQASMNTGVVAQQPTYQSAYDAQINALLNQYLNREKFSYDPETDETFQQYKTIYEREGNRSMNDTLAAAASGAGGMNSYAITAAQQANDYHMAQLTDKIPELKQLAYEMYMNDLSLQQQDIGLLMDMENLDYNRYRDQVSDYQWGTSFNYDASRDAIADQRYDQEWQYQLDRDAIADQRYDTEWQYGVSRDQIADQRYDQEWQYGLSRDQIEDAWRQKEWDYNVGRDQIADQRYQQEWDYNSSLYDDEQGGYDPDNDDVDDTPAPAPAKSEEDKRYDDSKTAMGIVLTKDSIVAEAILAGIIKENDDGSIAWAPGWNKDNWMKHYVPGKGFVVGMLDINPTYRVPGLSTVPPR